MSQNLEQIEGFFPKKRSLDTQKTHNRELGFSAFFTIENKVLTATGIAIAGTGAVALTVIGQPLKGLSFATKIVMTYLDLKKTGSKLKKYDKGKGVIVDFRGAYNIRKVQCIKIGNWHKISSR